MSASLNWDFFSIVAVQIAGQLCISDSETESQAEGMNTFRIPDLHQKHL